MNNKTKIEIVYLIFNDLISVFWVFFINRIYCENIVEINFYFLNTIHFPAIDLFNFYTILHSAVDQSPMSLENYVIIK